MPFRYVIDPSLNVLFVTASGILLDAELIEHVRDYTRHPSFKPDMRVLEDYSRVTEDRISAQALEECVKSCHYSNQAKRATVASTSLEYGMQRMNQTYCLMHGKTAPSLFTSVRDAIAFLNEGQPHHLRISESSLTDSSNGAS